jgi:sugar lactone lactonase YvrE
VTSTALADTHGAGARQQAQVGYLKAQGGQPTATHTPDDGDLADSMGQYDAERFAPGTNVSGPALLDARLQANALPTSGGAWTQDTTKAYNANPSNYTDPFWSNVGSGFSIVGGRVTTLDATADGNAWLAGAADGGVWRSTDQGSTWAPVFDSMPTLSIGALANAPDGSVWIGTGEANTSQDSYSGTGVYRSTDDGSNWSAVINSDGSDPLASRTVFRLAFDGRYAFAATDNGLWRYDGSNWTEILDPAPANDPTPWYDNQVTDVVVDPANPRLVLTVVGWRGPLTADSANGFYESTDGGQTFTPITPGGDINASDIGRTTFAWSADGTKLYAVIESPSMLTAGDESVLQGVFVTSGTKGKSANPAGTWTKIADEATLAASGSALAVGSGYGVGVQAWYNQTLAVDPKNASHVYLGLEEVFETSNAGATWDTANPYWNYPFACDTTNTCANVTHPDQHALMISNGQIVSGNDGGVYSRPLTDTGTGGWSDLNATMHNLQYYYAGAGNLPAGGVGIWGGLQDNGTALFDPNQPQGVEPAGGDGFDVIVNPANANDMVGEYTDLTMYSSTDGGHTFNPYVSPSCVAQETVGVKPRHDCDPSARFVAPFTADQTNVNDWVAGGRYIWTSTAGWNTTCGVKGCDWKQAYDTGAANAVTALSEANGAIYATWVSGGGNPGAAFGAGIVTNVGGWHQVPMTGLPDRYPAGIVVDKNNSQHAIVVFNGYSRRWIPNAGNGHVFETLDGGRTWTDISGNLPDVPSDAVVLLGSRIVVATDSGVFTASDGGGAGTQWSNLGTGLPNASVNDIRIGPDGTSLYAATHGRGVWSITP